MVYIFHVEAQILIQLVKFYFYVYTHYIHKKAARFFISVVHKKYIHISI